MASHIGERRRLQHQLKMAADVSSFVKQQQREERSYNSEILITKDLLGGLSQQQEKVSHERCSSPISPLSSLSSENKQNYQQQETNPDADFQDLNLNHPPSSSSSSAPQMNLLFEETCLDLKLQSSNHYQSVCTLDKVKSALQRAEKETSKKRPSPPVPLSSSAMFAAGCPGCLLYVITLKTNPKCPRCNSIVPCPLLVKKAKFDLNALV